MNIHEQTECLQAQLNSLKQQINSEPELPFMIGIPNRAYSVGETPVTIAEYRYYCAQANQEMPEQPELYSPTNPVVNVTFHDAQKYVTWLSEYTGERYSLFPEDEFEHCCADHREVNPDIAVYCQSEIRPVKTKKPNKYGLYDMLGCIWEWQESLYVTDSDCVVRGGSWHNFHRSCRSTYRSRFQPDSRHDSLGFRVIKQKKQERKA